MPRTGVWRSPDFLKLWTGQAVSQMGTGISTSALSYTAIYFLSATPLQMGYLGGAGAAAILLFGLFAGAWADRVRRRPILIAADLARAVLLAGIPLAAAFGRLHIRHLYLVAALSGILTVLFDVSYRAYVPTLLEPGEILEANSKLALTESIPEVAAPGLAGILVSWITAPITILFDSVSFVISAISLAMIRRPEPRPEREPTPHLWREIAEGLRTAWSNPILRAVSLRTANAVLTGLKMFCVHRWFAGIVLGSSHAIAVGQRVEPGGWAKFE